MERPVGVKLVHDRRKDARLPWVRDRWVTSWGVCTWYALVIVKSVIFQRKLTLSMAILAFSTSAVVPFSYSNHCIETLIWNDWFPMAYNAVTALEAWGWSFMSRSCCSWFTCLPLNMLAQCAEAWIINGWHMACRNCERRPFARYSLTSSFF